MRALIVCLSKEHGNSRRMADAMAAELGATVVEPRDVDPAALSSFDLVAFGGGIRFGRHYAELRALVKRLPAQPGRGAVIFSTSGFGWTAWHRSLRRLLEAKGFRIVGEHCCKGLDTMGLLRLFGGVNKGRPDHRDLAEARAFARQL